MKYAEKHPYDKPVDVVFKMYTQRSFFERKYRELGATELEVLECTSNDKSFSILCRFRIKNTAPVPDFAKKFMGDTNLITQRDSWDKQSLKGRIETEIKGVPVKISAEMQLRNEGGGCANHLQWTVSSGIPLIGGKLEAIVANDLKNQSGTDSAISRRLLPEYE